MSHPLLGHMMAAQILSEEFTAAAESSEGEEHKLLFHLFALVHVEAAHRMYDRISQSDGNDRRKNREFHGETRKTPGEES